MRNPNYSNLPRFKKESQLLTVFSPNPVYRHHKKKFYLPQILTKPKQQNLHLTAPLIFKPSKQPPPNTNAFTNTVN